MIAKAISIGFGVLFLALPVKPQLPELQRFDALIQAANYSQAVQELSVFVKAHPDSWQALYQLGYADFRLHRIQASVDALCKSLVLNRNSADSHKILAYDLNILGRQELAIHELNETLRCDPANAEAHYELGRIYYEQGLYLRSANELEKSQSLAPDFVRVYHNLGLAYSAIGENQKAVAAFEQGLALNSRQPHPSAWPLIDYATYLNMQNQPEKARDLLLQAIRYEKSWDEAYSELSKAYRALNFPEDAINALRQAIALNRSRPEYHYSLARLYTQLHQLAEAKQELAIYERYKTAKP